MSFFKTLAKSAVSSMQQQQQRTNDAKEWAEYASDDEVVRYAISGSNSLKKALALQQVRLRGLEREYQARR